MCIAYVTSFTNSPKLGVPRPVTGSHPDVACAAKVVRYEECRRDTARLTLKPGVPHPGLFPSTISLNAFGSSMSSLYSKGFKNPSVGRPLASRASFSKATMAANVGDEAEVPPMEMIRPERKTRNRRPCAATSGYARPFLQTDRKDC